MKLLILPNGKFDFWNAPAWFSDRLQKEFPQVEVAHLSEEEKIDREIIFAEIVIGWSLTPKQFSAARTLRWIHSPSAAVHQLMFPELTNSEVILTNARQVNGLTVAEHVVALIFALAKKLPLAMRLQHRRVWGQNEIWEAHPPPRQIAGATVGLVGLGSIGKLVADHASSLGMHVLAVRKKVENGRPENVDQIYGPAQIDLMLPRCDYVVIAAPLTSSTSKMFDAQRIAAMKPDSYLINVSRGALVDEVALAEALRKNQVAGAALDVFEHEPLSADSRLWTLENVLITPHTAGFSEKIRERQYDVFSDNLRRYINHEPLTALVDKTSGY